MQSNPPQKWFEMDEVRRRRLSSAVWIPLRQSETLRSAGEHLQPGSFEETLAVGSVAIYAKHREIGERLDWTRISLMHEARPYAFKDGRYKPADVYLHDEEIEIGVELVLVHSLNAMHEPEWLLNQDLMALGLVQEGDVWRRADEGYVDVVRRRRDAHGRPIAIEIRAEFLRDYLCARGLALRISSYRQRMAILQDASYLEWAENRKEVTSENERFRASVFPIDARGGPPGGGVFVMKVSRTDVDDDEDVPQFGPGNDLNTAIEKYTYQRDDERHAFRAEGELWCNEWIEPAARSERVRGDNPEHEFTYMVGASGESLPASDLNDEDIRRWLWFRPEVMQALLRFRGASLIWFTGDTGEVRCSPDYRTHFGLNEHDCINVYAYDIAKLPQWQQRVWVGHNIAPNGPVSKELLDSQMRAEPAETRAPEDDFQHLREVVNAAFIERYGSPLFRPHEHAAEILGRVHRFRALEHGGLLALAKDVARLTADQIDVALLRQIAPPPVGKENWRSLKLLEHLLSKSVGANNAHRVLGPLVGIYDLRLGDAHLPSSAIADAFKLVDIDQSLSPIKQALVLLSAATMSLRAILEGVRAERL